MALSVSPWESLSKASSSTEERSVACDPAYSKPNRNSTTKVNATFEDLPSEIIDYILAFLPPITLVDLSRTSRYLRSHANNDLLWYDHIRRNIPSTCGLKSPTPAQSWRQLYIAHHPYWFLACHKLWFADVPNTGKIILARYNERRGSIEAYQLIAEHDTHTFETWAHDSSVIIHNFKPKVLLWTEDPVINLEIKDVNPGKRLRKEIAMHTGSTHGICSMISLCQPIPESGQVASMALWPPPIVPSKQRVRNESPSKFRTESHRPQSLDVMSDQTFRIRKWLEFSNLMQPLTSVRMGEEVMTFSTLSPESYTPTERKPYQGIWVGDYSGHGCEFLLVLQGEVSSRITTTRELSTSMLPEGVSITQMEAQTIEESDPSIHSVIEAEDIERQIHLGRSAGAAGPFTDTMEHADEPGNINAQSSTSAILTTEKAIDSGEIVTNDSDAGRLEAIKLTGDINVPRGQYTWIAEDIGPKGLIRIGNEQMFKGARMVKSWGRIAGRGFRHDRFIPTQLILISHDTLAQYWEDFGHISFFKRVNVDDYLCANEADD